MKKYQSPFPIRIARSIKKYFQELIKAIKEQNPDMRTREERREEKRQAGRKRTDGKLKGGTEDRKAIKEAKITREVLGK